MDCGEVNVPAGTFHEHPFKNGAFDDLNGKILGNELTGTAVCYPGF